MSKTKRFYKDKMCMRGMSNRPHKVEKSLIKDITKDEKININNRQLGKNTPEPYDDIPVGALSQTKYIWKNGLEIKVEDDCYNVFFANDFVVNLNKQELRFFPWTTYLPLTSPPNLSKYRLV